MGNNLPDCGRRRSSERIILGDQSPIDTEEYYNRGMPLQQFELRVSNIRLKNVPFKQASIILQIEDVYQKTLDVRTISNGNARWQEPQKPVVFKANAYLLRKYFLKVVVLDESKILASQVKLNLYYIIMGPIQQDFPIELIGNKTKHKNSRIRLDIKISQCVTFQIKPSLVEVSLLNEHPGEAFHFSFKSITYKGQQTETADSYNVENALFNQRASDSQKQEDKRTMNTINILDAKTHKLVWNQQKSVEDYEVTLPQLNIQILTHDLNIASFHFSLWRVPKTLGDQAMIDQSELYSECQISFMKISRDNSIIQQRNGIQYEIRDVVIQEKLWYQGRETGQLKIQCLVTVPRFFRQLTVCVRTQYGIQTNNPILEQEGIGHCPEIKQLNRLKEIIQQRAVTIRELKNNPKGFDPRILNERRNLYQQLNSLVELMELSKSKVSIIYTYGSELDLFKGQIALLNVANKLFYLLGEEEITTSEICWRGLIAFMMRGQFLLGYMNSPSETKVLTPKKAQTDLQTKRINLKLEYQSFLYKALDKVLQCLNRQAIPESQRTFAELFCACSYFKIPQFRDRLLKFIEKKEDPNIQKEYLVNLKYEDRNIVSNFFDWDNNFYSSISHQQKYRQNVSDLIDILAEDSWRMRIQKRGGYFFYFIKYWVIYVDKIATNNCNIPWNEIPGYESLLQAFIGEMYKRKISEYPDIMVEAANKLLSNELLLGYFMKVLFQKTSIFDSQDILNCIQIITTFFKTLKTRNKRIPASFDYKLFFSGLQKILLGTHCFVISKCIQMIYSHFDMFSPGFKNDISLFLLGQPFFQLFLNWAPIVRINFFHFLVFKIQISLEGKSILTDEIYLRYRLLKTVLTNAQKLKVERQIIHLSTNFDQNYFKSMRRKLIEKKMRRGQDKNLLPNTNRYRISELAKVPVQRSLSAAYDKPPLIEFNREKRKKSYTPMEQQYQMQSQDMISLPQIRKKRKMTYDQTFALPEQIPQRLLEYIETALREFSDLQEQLNSNSAFYLKNPNNVPGIHTRIPIDKGQIRPDTLDDW